VVVARIWERCVKTVVGHVSASVYVKMLFRLNLCPFMLVEDVGLYPYLGPY
jgi:hypothetical protein